jgi:hypothetical protein
MLIGAVEAVTSEDVSGWIYSPLTDLHGTMALAYVDGECVGSGRVEHFRQDLADAGLSHGKLGFHFPVTLPEETAAGRVVVSPEGCEAIIMQRTSKIVGEPCSEEPALVGGRLPAPETVAWLRKRQAISKDEFDFLTSFSDFGVAAWPMQPARSGPGDRAAAREEAASSIVQLCDMAGRQVGRAEFSNARDLAEALDDEDHPISQAGLLVFHADRPLTLTVVEGSHRTSKRKLIADALDRGIRYAVEPSGLLVVHRLCAFRLEQPHARQFTVHYPRDAAGRAQG